MSAQQIRERAQAKDAGFDVVTVVRSRERRKRGFQKAVLVGELANQVRTEPQRRAVCFAQDKRRAVVTDTGIRASVLAFPANAPEQGIEHAVSSVMLVVGRRIRTTAIKAAIAVY
jgi:hypothetical protein